MKQSKISPVQSVTVDMETWRNQVNKRNSVSRKETLLRKAFQPMIFSMHCFGAYFVTTNNGTKKQSLWRVYCGVIGIILWFSVARSLTVFTPKDSLIAILQKCGYVVWMVTAAVAHFSCYRLSASGIIEEIFQSNGNEIQKRLKEIKIKATVGAGIVWSLVIIHTCSTGFYFFVYASFLDPMICPLNTMIKVDDKAVINVAGGLFLVFNVYIMGSVTCPLMWNFLLAPLFCYKFDACARRLSDVDIENRNPKNNYFETMRLQHQALCKLVHALDKFVCLTNASFFVGFIALIVLNLYTLISFPLSTDIDAAVFGTQIVWFTCSLIGLFMMSYGGIIVNNAAHKMYERIHDIDLTNMNTEAIGQIHVFLNRLCAEPIGFTVLRIFVIDRNTILTILGLLITYFLLIIQMAPPNSDINQSVTTSGYHNFTSRFEGIQELTSSTPQQYSSIV